MTDHNHNITRDKNKRTARLRDPTTTGHKMCMQRDRPEGQMHAAPNETRAGASGRGRPVVLSCASRTGAVRLSFRWGGEASGEGASLGGGGGLGGDGLGAPPSVAGEHRGEGLAVLVDGQADDHEGGGPAPHEGD